MNNLKQLYTAECLPVFQNLAFKTAESSKQCATGDINLVQNMDTGFIFNEAFDCELVKYDSQHQNEQALSQAFRMHLENVSTIIREHFQNKTLIEVGCGKGFFLEYLEKLGFIITGIDPTYEGENSSIIKEYFSPEIGLNADGVILRHVLEHVENPFDFLVNIRESNGGGGQIYIEVPCFEWICQNRAWFDIFYEHVNYFRLKDFFQMFDCIYDSGHVFGGQYIYVVADLATLRKPIRSLDDQFEFPSDFLSSVSHYANLINSDCQKDIIHSVIWGGASKGVIFAIFMQRAGVNIDFVVDINPAKQGKFLPITGLCVLSPEDEIIRKMTVASGIFITNSNYLSEIKQLTDNRFNYYPIDV